MSDEETKVSAPIEAISAEAAKLIGVLMRAHNAHAEHVKGDKSFVFRCAMHVAGRVLARAFSVTNEKGMVDEASVQHLDALADGAEVKMGTRDPILVGTNMPRGVA